jgi:hypothetical protein
MKSVLRSFFIILSGLLVLSSCGDEPTCVDRDTSLVKIDFVGEDGLEKAIIINSLSAIGENDGFPEYQDDTLSTLILPLNPGARSTTFILNQPTSIDTIGLSYDVVAQLISPECGLDAAFSKLDTTRITFPAAVIISSLINEQIETNIEITH